MIIPIFVKKHDWRARGIEEDNLAVLVRWTRSPGREFRGLTDHLKEILNHGDYVARALFCL